MKEETLTIYGLTNDGIAYCEAQGLSKCLAAYASNCSGETIESIGFNPNSGFTYIALENGVQICSSMGQDVDYIITDYANGEDVYLDSYDEALAYEPAEEEDLSCDQCNASMINGVYCHEHGCPNTNKIKLDGEWLTIEEDEE